MAEVITDNLDLWTSALLAKSTAGRGSNGKLEAYGIKKLRELILELAVRGKLVPQDPNDEPASVLLERIAKEKARLIREGLIKKEKPLPDIGDDEKSFALPNRWEWSRLQDVSSYVQRGKGPRYADFGKVQVVSQKCIQWAGFDLSQARYVDDASLDGYQPERFLCKDDLLWNSTGTGTAGRINVVPEVRLNSLVADSHVTIIRPLMVSSSFLSCYVAAPGIQQRIEPDHENSLVSGTTNQVELNLSAVVQLVVPVPPLAEQRRIVAKVDELMALCDQLEQQQTYSLAAHQTMVASLLSTLTRVESQQDFSAAWARIASHFDTLFTTEASIDQLKQTILQLAVMGKLVPQDPDDESASVLLAIIVTEKERLARAGEIKKEKLLPEIDKGEKLFELPNSWKWVRLGSISEANTGYAFKSAEYTESGTFVLRVTNINPDGSINRDDKKYIDPAAAEGTYKKFRLNAGDVLLVMVGGSLGKLGIVSDDCLPAVLNQNMWKLDRFGRIPVGYFVMILKYINGAQLKVTSSTHGHLAQGEYMNKLVPLPPLAEQHRIVAKVEELMSLCDALKARLADAQTTQLHLADAIVEQAVC